MDDTGSGSLLDIDSNRNPSETCLIQVGNKIISGVDVGSYFYARIGEVQSNNTVTWGSEYTVANGTDMRDIVMCYDSTNDRVVFGYVYYDGSNYAGVLKVGTVSQAVGTRTMTIGSAVNIGSASMHLGMVHNPTDGKIYMAFRDQTSGIAENGRLAGIVGIVASSGNSITVGSKTFSSSGNVQKSGSKVRLVYNPKIGRACLFWTKSGNMPKAGTVTSNSSNVFSFETSFVDLIGEAADPWQGSNMFTPMWNPTAEIIVGATSRDSNKTATFFATEHGDQTSNSNKFIGFADAGYTNGQTATVKVVGNTSTQSSLTPGSTYYVQDNGTLGTTAGSNDTIAGIALTSTKLLIRSK